MTMPPQPNPCRHLMQSPEAYTVRPGSMQPAVVWLCTFPDDEPARFMDFPRWIHRAIGVGLAIRPESDCAGCPAFSTERG